MKVYFILPGFIFLLSCKKSNSLNQEATSNKDAGKNNARIASGTLFNMLWNENGVTKRSFLHQNLQNGKDGSPINKPIRELCDLSEADLVGNPPNTWPYQYETTNGYIESPNKTAYSFKLVTEGYQNSEYSNYPGFAIWVQNGSTNSPLEFKLINSAKQLSAQRKLHEVGVIFEHWHDQWNVGRWSFKEQYNVDQLSYIKPKFDVRFDHFDNYQSPNTDTQTAYITADFRIEYWKAGDTIPKRIDLLGVIFSNVGGIKGYDYDGNPNNNIFWQDTSSSNPRVILHGYQLGLDIPNLNAVSSLFTTIEFDYKPLILQYLPAPPSGYTYSDAMIKGFDIYSSTRYADIDFSVKNIYLNSEYN